MRKFVTVRKISEIQPIEGADLIEVAVIDGWNAIVNKGAFQPGDQCVYFEIDSHLPDVERFEFLRKSSYKKMGSREGFRLRTRKLRGVVSQGLALPVKDFPEVSELVIAIGGEYVDLSEHLNVVKYEPPVPTELAGKVAGNFPTFIPKTDQERCQNLGKRIFGDELNSEYEITTKLDGSSLTAYRRDEHVGVCSRNWELTNDADNAGNAFVKMLNDSKLPEALNGIGRNIAIQGELMGPGIQGNREKLDEHHLYVFDIYDIDSGEYVSPDARMMLLTELYGYGLNIGLVHHTPILHTNVALASIGVTNTRGLIEYADGPSLKCRIREGVVFKRTDGGFSFKAISNQFLLKSED